MRRLIFTALFFAGTAAAVDGGVEVGFVQASAALLREGPSATARRIGRLPINAPLAVQSRQAGFVEVQLRTGKSGWLDARLVASQPVTREGAIAAARAAAGEEALTWWQRAAALDGHDLEVLGALADAYAQLHREGEARTVRSLVEYRKTRVFPVIWTATGTPTIELVLQNAEAPLPTGEVPRERWNVLGLALERPLWVLPSRGRAVRGQVRAVHATTWNECGGEQGLDAVFDAPLPKGTSAIAATFGDPPAAWGEDAPGATTQTFPATLTLRAAASYRFTEERRVEADTDLERFEVISRWGAGKARRDVTLSLLSAAKSVSVRDVLGDATPEFIVQTACETVLFSSEGVRLSSTWLRCCGC